MSDHHEVPACLFHKVFFALIILTVITVLVAQVDLGYMTLVVAMLIASVKAGLVALYFMHLKFEDKITWLYAGIPIFLLAVMLIGIFIDHPFRIDVTPKDKVVESGIPTSHSKDHH